MNKTAAIREHAFNLCSHDVLAILDGRKSQHRIPVKCDKFWCTLTNNPLSIDTGAKTCVPWWNIGGKNDPLQHCPFRVGERLWVRETWANSRLRIVGYKAGGEAGAWLHDGAGGRLWVHHGYILEAPGYPFGMTSLRTLGLGLFGGKWRSASSMPRWASRLKLHIESVRLERLNCISEDDAKAEGARCASDLAWGHGGQCEDMATWAVEHGYRFGFREIWETWYGRGIWQKNPWVWALTFKQVQSK